MSPFDMDVDIVSIFLQEKDVHSKYPKSGRGRRREGGSYKVGVVQMKQGVVSVSLIVLISLQCLRMCPNLVLN